MFGVSGFWVGYWIAYTTLGLSVLILIFTGVFVLVRDYLRHNHSIYAVLAVCMALIWIGLFALFLNPPVRG